MLHPDRSDPAATGQSGRRRALLEHTFEHGLRPARHGKLNGEDHDRRCSRVHADRLDARSSGIHRIEIGVAINTGRACRDSEPNVGSSATSASVGTGDITVRLISAGVVTRSFTCGY